VKGLAIPILNRYPRLSCYEEVQSEQCDSFRKRGLVCESGAVYTPRHVKESILYRVIVEHLETFLARQQERRRLVPRFVERELRSFLDCGILAGGFLRAHCDVCGLDRVVPYSCKCSAASRRSSSPRSGIAKILQRVPTTYLRALFASRLAGTYVYTHGLDANEVDFFGFLQEFKNMWPRASAGARRTSPVHAGPGHRTPERSIWPAGAGPCIARLRRTTGRPASYRPRDKGR
jgi:hypothetical protein